MTWAANRLANGPANRPTTPYAPGATVARPPRRRLLPDWADELEDLDDPAPVRTPLAPDGQPPRAVPTHPSPEQSSAHRPRRRRGSAARRLRVRLTERDAAILRDVVRFGALTVEQVGRRHFGSVLTAYGRLKALARAGYIELVRVWRGAPGACVATAEGTRVADAGLPPAKVSASTLAHHLTVADLAERLLAQHPGASWTTERELRRDAMAAARERGTGRLVDGVPHVPDGALILPDGQRVAVEVERSAKGSARYRAILGWYAAGMAHDRLRWFVADRRVRDRLATLVRAEQLDDLVSVESLPVSSVHKGRPARAPAGAQPNHEGAKR